MLSDKIKNSLMPVEYDDPNYIGITNNEDINRLSLSPLFLSKNDKYSQKSGITISADMNIHEISEIITDEESNDESIPTDLAIKNYISNKITNLAAIKNYGYTTDWLGINDGSASEVTESFNNGLYYTYLKKGPTNNSIKIETTRPIKFTTFNGKNHEINDLNKPQNITISLAPTDAKITTDTTMSWFPSGNDTAKDVSSYIDHIYISNIDTKNMRGYAINIGKEVSSVIYNSNISANRVNFVDPISYLSPRGGWMWCENNTIQENGIISPSTDYPLLKIYSIFVDSTNNDTTGDKDIIWEMIPNDGSPIYTPNISLVPKISNQYYYNTNDGYWYRWDGSSFIKRENAWLIGAVACDSTKILATKAISPKQIVNNINNIQLEVISNQLIRSKNFNSQVSVFGEIFESRNQYLEWDLSSAPYETQIFLYIDRTGKTIVSNEPPTKGSNGDYISHYNYWRCVGWCTRPTDSGIRVWDFNGSEPYTPELYDKNLLNSTTNNINRIWVKPLIPNNGYKIRVTCLGSSKVGFNYHLEGDISSSTICTRGPSSDVSSNIDFEGYKEFSHNDVIGTAIREYNIDSLPPIVPIYFEDPTDETAICKIEYIKGN